MILKLIYCLAVTVLISVNSFAQPHAITMTVTGGAINNYDHAQADYGAHPGDTLLAPSSVTSSISLGGITGTVDSPIYVMNSGKINMNGGVMFLKNLKYVKMIWRDPTDKYGLRIFNCGFRAVNTDSTITGCEFHGFDIYNNADYAFFTTFSRYWTGTPDDANHDNLFDSIRVVKSSGGWWFGNPSDSIGFWTDCEFKNFRIDSLNESTFWHANDCYRFKIHDCNITNNSLGDSTDAGIVDIHGSCNVWNVFLYNYSGSLVRWHGVTLVANKNQSEDTSSIHDNVCRLARKYGGVQINTLPSDTSFSWIRPGSIICTNNSMSKFYDRSYWVGPPQGGGGVPCDFYHCWGKTCKFLYTAYDSMHYDHGQNVAVSYLFHNGAGDTPIPDTTGNVRVINPQVTYSDTIHLVPFLSGVLTNLAIGQSVAPISINGIPRAVGKIAFVGAYNFFNQTFLIFKHPAVFKSN